MEVTQLGLKVSKKRWRVYLGSSLGLIFIVLLITATIIFHKQIQDLQAYGYLGVFIVGILCGITIIPTPVLLLVFTFGAVLKPLYGPAYVGPVYVGLVAGLGAAIGGITVYLTGAGVETIWSKLRDKGTGWGRRLGMGNGTANLARSKLWSKSEAFYNRLVKMVGGSVGGWAVFISSAMIISPFYFTGMAAGSMGMGLLRFFLISWAGKTIRYMLVAFAGYGGLYFLLKWIGG